MQADETPSCRCVPCRRHPRLRIRAAKALSGQRAVSLHGKRHGRGMAAARRGMGGQGGREKRGGGGAARGGREPRTRSAGGGSSSPISCCTSVIVHFGAVGGRWGAASIGGHAAPCTRPAGSAPGAGGPAAIAARAQHRAAGAPRSTPGRQWNTAHRLGGSPWRRERRVRVRAVLRESMRLFSLRLCLPPQSPISNQSLSASGTGG